MNMKSKLIGILSVLALASALIVVLVHAQSSQPDGADGADAAQQNDGASKLQEASVDKVVDLGEEAIYLIRLEDDPLATYGGGIQGLEATIPSARGDKKLDVNSPASVAYRNYLQDKQAALLNSMEQTFGRSLDVVYQYYNANNGMAVRLTAEEAAAVEKLPEVVFIQRDFERQLMTDNGPAWIGAPTLWDGGITERKFAAELSGDNEVPPVTDTIASGVATFSYNLETRELDYSLDVSDIISVTAAHIHVGEAGVNGPVVHWLYDETGSNAPGGSFPVTGTVTLSESEQGSLMNSGFYVNVHTEDNPAGEIRGQIEATGTLGEGIIVGVIDTGINPSNPSFADIGGDGYDHQNPFGSGNYVGVCDPGDPTYDSTFPCNDKLIGAWGYPSVVTTPVDYNGHGSHTASTAAGNFVMTATVEAPTTTITRTISGVAPHANIIAYNACCTLSALSAAIDQIVDDGVDVVNYSIGSTSPSDVWNDFDTVGYLNARAAGIFVATSAGNSGPDPETVGSPADAPWLTSVGASTHDRKFVNTLMNMSGGDTSPPADIDGKSITDGYGPAPIVYAGNYTSTSGGPDPLCLDPFPAGTFSGEIVVCDRGEIARTEKGENVAAGGAGGYILANAEADGDSLSADAHVLPAVHITYDDGVTLKNWLASGSGHMATISGTVLDVDDANGDIMASFSSRGANRALPDIIVPSVSAPGVDIIAAYGTDDAVEWNAISGTSMSSPHTAGSAALLMALHPNWTPAEIQSALMTTSWTDVLDNDGTEADWFDMGSGRVDLTVAGKAGLVLDETISNYTDADPAAGGDPKTLNLASMGNADCILICSWTRTVSSTLDVTATWTISATSHPSVTITTSDSSIELGPGADHTVVVTATVAGDAETGTWHFGEVTLSPDVASVPDAHLPVAVVPSTGSIPSLVEINTRADAGSYLAQDLESIEITDLTIDVHGLSPADMVEQSIPEDPTNSDPYDDVTDGAFFITTTVPANTARLVAEITESTAPDIDLFVGMDTNSNGMPDSSEQICSSTTPSFDEYCDVSDPAAGTWWILVQNWAGSGASADDVKLAYAKVPVADQGNMTVEGPSSVPATTPFDLRVFFNVNMNVGDRAYGAFSIGTDSANAGNLGRVPVNIIRHEDAVSKAAMGRNVAPDGVMTYTLTVHPNLLPEDLTYTLTDTIPAGMSYITGTAMASSGAVSVTDNVLTWTGTLLNPLGEGDYSVTTSLDDPACNTGIDDGGYIDLESLAGFFTNPGISGDTVGFIAFSSGNPFNYYGAEYTGLGFTDDGFAIFDFANYGGTPWVAQAIPDGDVPNNVLAMLWQDTEIVYDGTNNYGVTLATAGPNVIIIEYDDIQILGDPSSTYDFEIIMTRAVDNSTGAYEIVYAYDNLVGSLAGPLTVGVENQTGAKATALVNNDDASAVLQDGLIVCFDYEAPNKPVTITYQVRADADADLGSTMTNTVTYTSDNPGSEEQSTSASVVIGASVEYMPLLFKQ